MAFIIRWYDSYGRRKKKTIQFEQLLAMPDLALSNLAVFRGSDEDFEVRACAQDFVSANHGNHG